MKSDHEKNLRKWLAEIEAQSNEYSMKTEEGWKYKEITDALKDLISRNH